MLPVKTKNNNAVTKISFSLSISLTHIYIHCRHYFFLFKNNKLTIHHLQFSSFCAVFRRFSASYYGYFDASGHVGRVVRGS